MELKVIKKCFIFFYSRWLRKLWPCDEMEWLLLHVSCCSSIYCHHAAT